MTRRPDWKKVADRLAARLMHHAYCDSHPNPGVGLSSGCPFCKDAAAYRFYRDAGGAVRPPGLAGAALSIDELANRR